MTDPTKAFYDDLAPYYHLVYSSWEGAVERDAEQLDAFIRSEWGEHVSTVLDAAAGIGTQALGLAGRGYEVTASDVSAEAIARAEQHARSRNVRLSTAVADLRRLSVSHTPHDLVLAWDNALPHLLSDEDVLSALRECYRCTSPGGGCLFSVRDYAQERRIDRHMIAYGVRETANGRTAAFQVRDWDGDHYDVSFYFVENIDGAPTTRVAKGGRYYAISVHRLLELMRAAGYRDVHRVDEPFFQPALVGHRA